MKIPNIFNNEKPTVHPKVDKPIKYRFSIGGIDYYEFETLLEMPEMRFKMAMRFAQEMQNKCDVEYLDKLCEKGLGFLDKGELVKTGQLLSELKYRLEWAFEPDTLYRYASVYYFDLKENINQYDSVYNKRKIDRFKKKEMLTYFVRELIEGSEKLLELSKTDLETYLQELEEKKKSSLISESSPKGG